MAFEVTLELLDRDREVHADVTDLGLSSDETLLADCGRAQDTARA